MIQFLIENHFLWIQMQLIGQPNKSIIYMQGKKQYLIRHLHWVFRLTLTWTNMFRE